MNRFSEIIIKHQRQCDELEKRYLDQQQSFQQHSLHYEDSTPPVLALSQAEQSDKLVNGPYMLFESFIPLLKLVIKTMEGWLNGGKTMEFTVNQIRQEFLHVRK